MNRPYKITRDNMADIKVEKKGKERLIVINGGLTIEYAAELKNALQQSLKDRRTRGPGSEQCYGDGPVRSSDSLFRSQDIGKPEEDPRTYAKHRRGIQRNCKESLDISVIPDVQRKQRRAVCGS